MQNWGLGNHLFYYSWDSHINVTFCIRLPKGSEVNWGMHKSFERLPSSHTSFCAYKTGLCFTFRITLEITHLCGVNWYRCCVRWLIFFFFWIYLICFPTFLCNLFLRVHQIDSILWWVEKFINTTAIKFVSKNLWFLRSNLPTNNEAMLAWTSVLYDLYWRCF